MLKGACVFDRAILQDFFKKAGVVEEYNDFTMYYGLFEKGDLIGIVKMYPKDDGCMIEDVIWKGQFPFLYEEFLVKSAINFALTFNTQKLIMTKKCKEFLIPMNFVEKEEFMVGKTDEVDFPHNCCGK